MSFSVSMPWNYGITHRYLHSAIPEPPIILAQETVQNAPLTCSTEIIPTNVFEFGFTAKTTFYWTGSLPISKSSFLHDELKLKIMFGVDNVNAEIAYSSISKMNFESRMLNTDCYAVNLIVNIKHVPTFFAGIKQPNGCIKWTKTNPAFDFPQTCWKDFINATAFRVTFYLSKLEMHSFLNAFYQTDCSKLLFQRYSVEYFDLKTIPDFQKYFENHSFEEQYIIQAILACGTVGEFFLLHAYGNIDKMARTTIEFLSSIYYHLRKDLSLPSLDCQEFSAQHLESNNYVFMKTIYVTPTKIIPRLEAPIMDCRAFRILGAQNLIQVKFRNDAYSYFPKEFSQSVIRQICYNGIKIAGKHFHEFGGSHSLFFQTGSYFYATDDKKIITILQQSFGNFGNLSAAKMEARLGQFFTSAWNTGLKLPASYVCVIQDTTSKLINSAGKPYIFTDGCGLISYQIAERIAKSLDLKEVPSAFQIRYAGYKGMLTVEKNDAIFVVKGIRYHALLRESQRKFTSNNIDFDIVEWSKPAPFNLHQTFIEMLDYVAFKNGKQDNVRERLRELNKAACMNIIKPLLDKESFLKKLQKLSKFFPALKMECKNLLMNESFPRAMVEANALIEAKMLAIKTQISLPFDLGRTAFGIPDHTGTLKEGQIFFQCSGKSLSGIKRIGVTRSPLHHPSDIRYYDVVDADHAPALCELKDLFVFPTVGKRPHCDEMGGGDFDGDTYSGFWDPAFMFDCNIPAPDFIDLEVDMVPKIDITQLQHSHPIFRGEHQILRNIEQISVSHRIHLLLHDPQSVQFKEFLKNMDRSVNYSKSGLPGRQLKQEEKHFFRPTFMQTVFDPCFTGSHILFELYEYSNKFYQLICIAQKEAALLRQTESPNSVHVAVSDEIKKLFDRYKAEIDTLMAIHGIKTEGELFSNAFSGTLGTLSTAKMPLMNDSSGTALVQKQLHQIFKNYRTTLLDKFSITLINNRWQKFDWKMDMEEKKDDIFSYKFPQLSVEFVQTAQQMYSLAEENKACYSFPWLLWEGLDLWWSRNYEPKRIEFDNSIDVHVKQKNLQAMFENVEMPNDFIRDLKQHGLIPLPWYISFNKFCYQWFNMNVPANKATFQKLIQTILSDVLNGKIPKIFTADEAYLHVLLEIINNQPHLNIDPVLVNAAQATLVKMAFLPKCNVLTELNVDRKLIDFPSFVVQIPQRWSNQFQDRFKELKLICGCEDIAIRKLNQDGPYHRFTIMCRGTLNSHQKLKALLTPNIKTVYSTSMEMTKKEITEEMRKIWKCILSFREVKDCQFLSKR